VLLSQLSSSEPFQVSAPARFGIRTSILKGIADLSPGWPSNRLLLLRRPGDGTPTPSSRARAGGPLLHSWQLLAVGAVLVTAGCGTPERSLGPLVDEAVQAGPGRGSPEYRPPSDDQARAVALSMAGLAAGADLEAPPDGYRLAEVPGEAEDVLVALEEVPQSGRTRGSGLYVVRAGGGSDLVVQVPHPVADAGTEALGARLFDVAAADVLMVAGAHRTAGGGSADVANVPGSVFTAVSDAVVGPGSVVLQVHGFAAENHPDSYGDAVLSTTVDEPSALVERLAEGLRDAGFDVCVYDGQRCDRLAGTRNVQAEQARAVGAEFVHLEVSDRARRDPDRQERLVATLAAGVRGRVDVPGVAPGRDSAP
jgi:hypothetical protein